jgi:hypothetical protein
MSTTQPPREKRGSNKPPVEAAKPPAPTENGNSSGNRPVHEIRMGRIVGAIWANSDGNGHSWFNVTFARIYRDDAGNWYRADSFGKSDLPLVVKIADRCHDWMFEQTKTDE